MRTRADAAAERIAHELSNEDEPTAVAALAAAVAHALAEMSLPEGVNRQQAALLFFAQVATIMKGKDDGRTTTQASRPRIRAGDGS
jgi:hypothetical protein